MKIKIEAIMENETGVKVPKTIKKALELANCSRAYAVQQIEQNGEFPVQKGDYWFILVGA